MKKVLALSLLTLIFMGFGVTKTKNYNILLILRNPMNEEFFSKFNISNDGSSLFGKNLELSDYPVPNGIYRIESASNDYYYSKHIVINEDIYK